MSFQREGLGRDCQYDENKKATQMSGFLRFRGG